AYKYGADESDLPGRGGRAVTGNIAGDLKPVCGGSVADQQIVVEEQGDRDGVAGAGGTLLEDRSGVVAIEDDLLTAGSSDVVAVGAVGVAYVDLADDARTI